MGRRIDGVNVLCCDTCGLGVVETVPADLTAYYDDAYYGAEKNDDAVGYGDYQFTAEHGVSWAAAIVELLKPEGRILDIGCVDGTLLARVPDTLERYGIEMNERMAERAAAAGTRIIGRDILDPAILRQYRGHFDVVTSIAVFEHIPDLRQGMRVALDLLKPDGILLFEVPFISAEQENRIWFESSLEHVYYPSGDSMRLLIESLGAQLVGGEIYIRDFASNYIGIAFHDLGMIAEMRCLFSALTSKTGHLRTMEQQRVRQQIMLVHAAESTPDLLAGFGTLPASVLTPPLMQRFEQLWCNDLRRLAAAQQEGDRLRSLLAAARAELAAAQQEGDRLRSLLAAARTEAANLTRVILSNELLACQKEATTLRQLSEARTVAANATAQAEGLQAQFNELLGSTTWKVTAPLRRFGARMPQTARLLRQAMKLIWWSVRLEMPSRVRETLERRQRMSLPVGQAEQIKPTAPEVVSAPPLVVPPLVFRQQNRLAQPLAEDDELDPWPAGRPLVSVIIPSFNYGHFVSEAVDSVLAQTFTDLEVIVVEGGSTDPESRRLTLALERPRTRVIVQPEPNLIGANRNFGISHARGKYICCLDADDLLMPTYIEKAVFLLEAYDRDLVSTGGQYFGNRDGRWGILEEPTLADMLDGNQMLTCAVFRRRLWRQSGGYRDTELGVTGHVYEDWMFWTRLAALGARMRNMNREYLFLYRSHGPSLSTQPNLHPMDVQRALIHQANADLIVPEAIARSNQAAVLPSHPVARLQNLISRPVQRDARRPVLLLALPFIILGGAERLLSGIVSHLTERGWRVLITTSIDPGMTHGDMTPWFEPATSEIYHLPRFLPPECWPDFVRYLIASRGVDVLWVVGSAFMYDLLPSLCAEFPAMRVADLLFNTVGHTANNRKYARLIDVIFVENEEVLRFLRDTGNSGERVALVTSGIDLQSYQPGPRDPGVVNTVGAAPGELIVGFSGRWSEEKDPLAFVEIARCSQHLPLRFVMTGAGAMRQDIEQALCTAALPEGRFTLRENVEDVVPWLRTYDVLVLPSRLDGRPVVVLEALALGVPVLASRVGALPELIEDGVNGFLCQPGDVNAFVERLGLLVQNPDLLTRMRTAARAFAERSLDARQMLARYEERLLAVLQSEARLMTGA